MPDGKRIVCDTGPLLHLREAGSLDLLRVAGQVSIPPAVEAETAALDPKWSSTRPEWIAVVPLQPPFDKQASDWKRARVLDPGEAEALALAAQLQADWLLTDDMAARLLANHQRQEAMDRWVLCSGLQQQASSTDPVPRRRWQHSSGRHSGCHPWSWRRAGPRCGRSSPDRLARLR